MKLHFRTKIVLAVLVSLVLLTTGCTAQWVSVALADLPVLTQMALNIATVGASLQSGQQISASEAAAIQNISTETSADLSLLQSLYNEYKANPGASTLQKIQNVIADLNQNLPALLLAAHLSDPKLATRVTAAVNLILTTVGDFALLIPQQASGGSRHAANQKTIPYAADLKKRWNQQACAPTGRAEFDTALAVCAVR